MKHIRKIYTGIQVFAWIFIFILFCWILKSEGHSDYLFPSVGFTIIFICIFYSHSFILKRYLRRKKMALYFTGLFLILIICPSLFFLVQANNVSSPGNVIDSY